MTGNLFQKMVGGVDRDLSIRRDGLTDLDSPKHGKMDPDNAPHVGGNTWAGGTGGRDTAGMGGIGGPYRLDAGHDVHQVSDEVKEQVPEHIRYVAYTIIYTGQASFYLLEPAVNTVLCRLCYKQIYYKDIYFLFNLKKS